MQIQQLKLSLRSLPYSDAINLILAVRNRRRTGAEAKAAKQTVAKVKKVVSKASGQKVKMSKALNALSKQEKLFLLQELMKEANK